MHILINATLFNEIPYFGLKGICFFKKSNIRQVIEEDAHCWPLDFTHAHTHIYTFLLLWLKTEVNIGLQCL